MGFERSAMPALGIRRSGCRFLVVEHSAAIALIATLFAGVRVAGPFALDEARVGELV